MTIVERVKRYVAGSLARQLVLAVVLVHSVLIAVLVWQLVISEGDALEKQRITRAQGLSTMLAASGGQSLLSQDTAALGELVRAASSLKAVRYALFTDLSGRVLAHTEPRRTGKFLVDAPSRSLKIARAAPQVVASSGEIIDIAAPVRLEGRTIGWARVGISLADIHAAQRTLALNAITFGAVAVLLGWLVALLVARTVTRRLEHLAKVTERFRLGERQVRVRVAGWDEVSLAGNGVNMMLDAVEDSERALTEVQRIAKVGSWAYDPRKPQLWWSDQVFELFGMDPSADPPTFEQFVTYLSEEHRAMILELASQNNHRTISSFNLTIRRPDGTERICWAQAKVIERLADGTPVLSGICQDVTEREHAAAQLRQSQKMEAVGQLTGGLAHDFNNLLAVIVGNLDILAENVPADSTSELISDALEAALRGSELTKQLLAFSRRQPLAPQTIDLNQLMSGMASLWRRTLGDAVEVRVNLTRELWLTQADPSQVEAAVLNLVINARDAMPSGGVLSVETRNATVDPTDEESAEPDMEPGDYCVITVSDTGTGMSADVCARAFEPFFTTKAVGEGSGLGLSMVYGFAKQSRGHVRIYSEPEHGTAVSIYLPRAVTTSDFTDEPKHETAMAPALGELIMLVEDNESVRKITARQLTELGYRVRTAANGPEALILLDERPQPDLLLTDVVMPGGMSGIELSDAALARIPGLKVVHMSGFTANATRSRSDPGSFGVLLTKPFRKAELASTLREAFDGSVQASARGPA
ncbi:MAG TPA: ATP-binding protein [Sphingomicrobium sp.]|nr:ATP-binding protein [Sphingomicrobium sp.]